MALVPREHHALFVELVCGELKIVAARAEHVCRGQHTAHDSTVALFRAQSLPLLMSCCTTRQVVGTHRDELAGAQQADKQLLAYLAVVPQRPDQPMRSYTDEYF